ncbi:MAG: Fic family protein [Candidatus Omnitrophota bacterium]
MAVPHKVPKLPPKIDYAALVTQLGRAHNALGRLNGLIANLHNPALLAVPLLTKEAVLSSRIEGTRATLEEVFEYEAAKNDSESTERGKDVREIINYRFALNTALKNLEKRPLSGNLMKELHSVLLDSVRGANKDRGNFRKLQVYIGKPGASIEEAEYIPPAAGQVPELMADLEKYLNSDTEKDPLVQIGIAHYQFEAIHPFLDGNGRVGRLLIPLFLYERKLLSYPLLYISEFFEENREMYYALLNDVRLKGDWTSWLNFFLDAVSEESGKTQSTVLKILDLHKKLTQEVMADGSANAVALLDIIFTTPAVSFVSIKERLKAKSNQTIYNLLDKFMEKGILKEIPGKKRNKVYVFRQLMEILK